jgi:hypothetical protein
MDRTRCLNASDMDGDDSFATAQSVRTDFDQLINVLDQRLANLSDQDEEVRAHILEARATAVRGQELSRQLVEALRP